MKAIDKVSIMVDRQYRSTGDMPKSIHMTKGFAIELVSDMRIELEDLKTFDGVDVFIEDPKRNPHSGELYIKA